MVLSTGHLAFGQTTGVGDSDLENTCARIHVRLFHVLLGALWRPETSAQLVRQ